MTAPIIYNLFPRLAGTVSEWAHFGKEAKSMGFNWIYLNPISQPGFSGSLYSVRDYRLLCQDFVKEGQDRADMRELKAVLTGFQKEGLLPIMDLVINHTAIDSPLVKEHPAWYQHDENGQIVHPSAIDPADARKVTVWGDLAEIDNNASPEKEALWNYWSDLLAWSQSLGFVGFRCDAAYKVPAALWARLIKEAKARDERTKFFAETLGCRLEEVSALKEAGMDYLFNSSKYWNFDAPWALTQHEQFGSIAPSVSFAESHDTERLFAEVGGRPQVVCQRYLLAAIFSEGLLMPMGFELGFTKRLNVVTTKPADREEINFDFRPFIKSVNVLKQVEPLLQTEGHLKPLTPFERPTMLLEKRAASGETLVALINKDWDNPQKIPAEEIKAVAAGHNLWRISSTGKVSTAPCSGELLLDKAEIALLLPAR